MKWQQQQRQCFKQTPPPWCLRCGPPTMSLTKLMPFIGLRHRVLLPDVALLLLGVVEDCVAPIHVTVAMLITAIIQRRAR